MCPNCATVLVLNDLESGGERISTILFNVFDAIPDRDSRTDGQNDCDRIFCAKRGIPLQKNGKCPFIRMSVRLSSVRLFARLKRA